MIRPAAPQEFDATYLMGFDVWGQGQSSADYLEQCRNSLKFKRGQRFVLEANGEVVSSLMLYHFEGGTAGIGSVATAPALRKKGHASALIKSLLSEKRAEWTAVFLYCDIGPEFYEKLGFRVLDPSQQKYLPSVCMVHGEVNASTKLPGYF